MLCQEQAGTVKTNNNNSKKKKKIKKKQQLPTCRKELKKILTSEIGI